MVARSDCRSHRSPYGCCRTENVRSAAVKPIQSNSILCEIVSAARGRSPISWRPEAGLLTGQVTAGKDLKFVYGRATANLSTARVTVRVAVWVERSRRAWPHHSTGYRTGFPRNPTPLKAA